MAFIFDHLIAILVGATLLGALIMIQQRGQQSAIETTTRHRTETQTSSFLATLSRDLENARTSRQITTGLGTWPADAVGSGDKKRAFGIYGTDTHTDRVEFVTLADPDAGSASALQAVGYQAVATGETATVGGVTYPLYRVDRYVYEAGASAWVQRGGSADNLIQFSLEATRLGGGPTTDDRLGDAPARVAIRLAAAERSLTLKAGDQAARTRTNATRQAVTVRIANASSTGDASAVAPAGGPQPFPLFPGIDPPAPPSGGTPGTPGSDDPGDTGSPGGSDDPTFTVGDGDGTTL